MITFEDPHLDGTNEYPSTNNGAANSNRAERQRLSNPSMQRSRMQLRTLVLLGIESIDAQQAKETLHILLKYQTDIAKAAKELSVDK